MEPFVSRDGRWLFFNNSNDPKTDTDLFWAERVDDLTFRFKGPISGANSRDLDGVASMDRDGNFFFISSRAFAASGALIHQGRFTEGRVTDVALVRGLGYPAHLGFNFDAEISADGGRLYYVESRRDGPSATLAVADRQPDGSFVKDPRSDLLMRAVNQPGLTYAPDTSADQLELFFTHLPSRRLAFLSPPQIYMATRRSKTEPFGPPVKIAGLGPFIEAPSIAADGTTLYYHACVKQRCRLMAITVTAPPASK